VKSSIETKYNADNSKEVTAHDANFNESYRAKYDAEGFITSYRERGGKEWTSKDGGRTFNAEGEKDARHERPVIRESGNLVRTPDALSKDKDNPVTTLSPEGMRTTEYKDGTKVTEPSDGGKVTERTTEKGKETVAQDSKGNTVYTMRVSSDGKNQE